MRNAVGLLTLSGAMLVACCSLAAAEPVPFIVNTTNDSGPGSLRQAILDADSASQECAAQAINFAIPGTGLHTIRPTSALPNVASNIFIDGYSQSGSVQNTLTDGTNAVLTIEIDGSLAGSSNGLRFVSVGTGVGCSANGTILRGVVVNRFALAGIETFKSPCPTTQCFQVGVRVEGSYIGTDSTGLIARGNGVGMHFGDYSNYNIIGDQVLVDGGSQTPPSALRNVISGNLSDGIRIDTTDTNFPSTASRIRGNYIGVDAAGTHAVPNGRYGVLSDIGTSAIQIQNNIIAAHPADGVRILDGANSNVEYNAIGVGIGGVALGNAGDGIHVANLAHAVSTGFGYPSLSANGIPSIAYNTGAGLFADDTVTVDVVSGSFGHNGGLGIDLAPRGPTPNDPLDADSGPNELLNAPVLMTATRTGSTATVTGTLDSTPNTQSTIDFYITDACDSSGYGEGLSIPQSANVTTDASGHGEFSSPQLFLGEGITVTALNRRFASSTVSGLPELIVSEFSNCKTIGDEIFADGFDP